MIITSDKKKIHFGVEEWDDFDNMPSLGVEVNFIYQNSVATSIVTLNNLEKEAEVVQESNGIIEASQSTKKDLDVENEVENNNTESDESDVIPNNEDSLENPTNPLKAEVLQESNSIVEASQSTKKDLDVENEVENNNTESDESDVIPNNEDSLENPTEVQKATLEHFEDDPDIMNLEGIENFEDELAPREESVTITLNLSKAVSNYFDIIHENIEKRSKYKQAQGRLNYITIRRFLWTTFNNLTEMDAHILTPKIKYLSDDLRSMATVYNDFTRKTKYPPLAYAEVFLSCQKEYNKIRDYAEATIERLNQLKNSEKHLDSALKVKKEKLSKEINTEEFSLLQSEFKSLNGTYVDIVHMMAELDERYKHDMKLLTEFEEEYRKDFYTLFNEAAKKYKIDIVEILSAQAFTLDEQLWNQAKTSKSVRAHFKNSNVTGELNTTTYLKYYLSSQDSNKATEETKKLFKLYDYLVSLQKDHIMIVLNDANDAIEFEAVINSSDKKYLAKSFINEKESLRWAIKNNVKVLILENNLAKINAKAYLRHYKKYVLQDPKIILLSHSKKDVDCTIQKLLSRGVSARVVAKNIKEILAEKPA